MAKRTWVRAERKQPVKVSVPPDVHEKVAEDAIAILSALKRRLIDRRKQNSPLAKAVDITAHWHQNGYYFTAHYEFPDDKGVVRTSPLNVARILYKGNDRFEVGFPMRRGWTISLKDASLDECMVTVRQGVFF